MTPDAITEIIVALCVLAISGTVGWVFKIQKTTHALELKISENYMHKNTGDKIFSILKEIQSTIHDMDTRISVMVATDANRHVPKNGN